MKFFYLSSKPNSEGKFEIHERECNLIPSAYDRDYLGPFNSGREAISKASNLRAETILCDKCGSDNYVAAFRNLKRENQ